MSRYAINNNPFDEPAFLEGLEAAGYLQRLDTSEARITARYQHALAKMKFALHSEEFLTRSGVRKVHGSTVQFFNETPVSDPFVHVMVGSLPPSKQALVTPAGLPTTAWTPIGSPEEADGTLHFTVSHAGFWPLTVVLDANQQDLGREGRYQAATDDEDDYAPPRSSSRSYGTRRPSRSNTGRSFYDDADTGRSARRQGSMASGYGGGAGRSGSAYGGSNYGGASGSYGTTGLGRRAGMNSSAAYDEESSSDSDGDGYAANYNNNSGYGRNAGSRAGSMMSQGRRASGRQMSRSGY